MPCKGRNEDGTPCRLGVVLGNGYCLAHQDQAPEKPVRWTRKRLERAIAAHGGPDGLDLGDADLSGLDLGLMNLHGIVLSRWDQENSTWMVANLQGANLRRSNLQKADLFYTYLQGAILRGTKLQQADLEHANLQGAELCEAKLQEAKLGFANLQGAFLVGADVQGAILWEANLQGADLRSADLRGASLYKANLRTADLRRANLREVDLLDVRPGGLLGIRLYRAKLDHTKLKKEQLGPDIGDEQAGEYREARDAYLALKQNFDNWGDYAASAWAYQKERKMEKATKAPWRCRNSKYYGEENPFPRLVRGLFSKLWPNLRQYGRLPCWSPLVCWFWFKYTVKWLADGFVELLCGYGESIWRVLLWMGVALFGFATFYWYIGGVKLVDPISEPQATATSFLHYLIYSVGAFTTTGFARFQPADDRVRLITALQAIIGIFLAGLLGFVAGNRIRRS